MHNIGSTGGRVKEKGRKYAGGGTWSGHAQQDFGRGSAEQTWEVRELCKGSTKEGNAGGKESTWEEWVKGCGEVCWWRDQERACSTGIWEANVSTVSTEN